MKHPLHVVALETDLEEMLRKINPPEANWKWTLHFFILVVLFLDCKMFLPVIQVHPFKEERSQRRSIRGQLLMRGNPSSTETTPFMCPTGHWRISPDYSIKNDWTFSSGSECHNRNGNGNVRHQMSTNWADLIELFCMIWYEKLWKYKNKIQ